MNAKPQDNHPATIVWWQWILGTVLIIGGSEIMYYLVLRQFLHTIRPEYLWLPGTSIADFTLVSSIIARLLTRNVPLVGRHFILGFSLSLLTFTGIIWVLPQMDLLSTYVTFLNSLQGVVLLFFLIAIA
jgi:hypothetical protein